MKKNKNTVSLDKFLDTEFGLRGTKKRSKFEAGYDVFKQQVIAQQELSTFKKLKL